MVTSSRLLTTQGHRQDIIIMAEKQNTPPEIPLDGSETDHRGVLDCKLPLLRETRNATNSST